MNYITRLLFLILLPTFVFAQTENNSVKIGVLTDLSGLGAYWGKQTEVGVKILETELNAKGQKVEFIFEDHRLEPKAGVGGAVSLLNLHDVDAIYSEFAVINNPVAPVVAKAKKLFVGASAAVSFIEKHPQSFKTYLDYNFGCRRIAEQWKDAGYKKVAILKSEAEFGEICLKAVREFYSDIKVVGYNFGSDVKAEMLLIKQFGAEAVLNVATEDEMLNMLQVARKIDYHPIIGANSDAFSPKHQDFYNAYPAEITAFSFIDVAADFVAKVKKVSPENSLVSLDAAALAYLHLKQMVKAIQSCPNYSSCQTELLAKSKPDKIIGFEGFKDRQALFQLKLKLINK